MADNNTSTEHWWRVAYGLKRLRKGLEHFVDRRSRAVYTDFYINGLTSAVCNTCQLNRQCPNGVYKTTTRNHNSFCRNNFCDCICDRILLKYYPYQKTPIWANTDSTKWSDRNIGYWEVAKCFLRCPGYLDKKGPNTMDASGLLNICLNNTDIRSSISNIPIFEEVRDIRNKVNHSSDYKLDKQTADDYLGKMIEVLNDANELRHDNFAVVNRRRLNEIKDGNIKCSSKESIRRELDISAHEKNNVEKDEAYNMFDSSQMSEERIHFTATLVRMYALFKEEMEKKTALRLRKYLLTRAFLCDKDEARQWCRKSLVDDILKRIIFSSCETTKKRFQEQFAKDKAGAELSRKFEQCNVLTEEIEEFRNLQKRRTREQFEYKKCVRYIAMVNPLNDLDMIADKLLSAYIINLAEHSDIVQTHDKDLKLDMFKTAISRCDKGVLPLLKDKCAELHIRCILYEDDESPERGVEEKSTEDAILSSPNVKWFLSQGCCFMSAEKGSIILTFGYSDPLTLYNCLQECKNGRFVDFVNDIFTDEPVLMTIPEGEHNVHVKIKTKGTNEIIVILTGSFLNRKKMCHQADETVPEHDVTICEELEITRDLITQLQKEHVVPENITYEQFDNMKGRRNNIHYLLSLCDQSFDYSEFFNIISKQYSDPHTMFTCSCKIVKREKNVSCIPITSSLREEEPLCIETSLVRGPAAKDELTQTGNFSEATAIARDMQPELHTETKNETPDDDNDKMAKLFGDTRNMVGLNKYMTTLREKGPTTLNRKLEYDLDKWRYFEVKIAVVGSSGSGKSSLINAVLDLKTRQEEMADVGVIEKTTTVISYRNKDRPNLVFYDFPGVGTNYPKHTYFDYDFFLIVSKDKLSENDLLFAREIQKREKKFYFVRTHIDATLRNDKRSKPKTHNENMVKEDVKNAIFKTLSREAITKDDCHIFLLDNYEKEKFDFKRLLKTLIMNTPDYKRQTLTLSLAADVEETINEKVEVLKARIYTVALHASLGSGELRPFFESDTNEAVLYKEGNLYREQLGIDDKSLKKNIRSYEYRHGNIRGKPSLADSYDSDIDGRIY